MMKLSRGALAAIAAAVAVPASVAIAHNFDRHGGGWHRMSPDARARLDEGRLAMAKTALKLNADQEKLWAPVETEIRAGFKLRAERMEEREKMREERRAARDADKQGDAKTGDAKRPDISERFEKMSQRMGERAERMKAFSAAFKPFYASLSDEQKEVLRPLMREMMPGGGRGHGKRWAHGGDEGRGWGHGGWGRHGGHHEGRGMREERRGGGAGGAEDRGPPAEQMMPDAEEASPAAPDNL